MNTSNTREYLTRLYLPCPPADTVISDKMVSRLEMLDMLGLVTLVTLAMVSLMTLSIVIRYWDKVKYLLGP